jgi:hypothetical protein
MFLFLKPIVGLTDESYFTYGEWKIVKPASDDQMTRAFTFYRDGEVTNSLRVDRNTNDCENIFVSLQLVYDNVFDIGLSLSNQLGQIRVDELNSRNVFYNVDADKGSDSMNITFVEYEKLESIYNELEQGNIISVSLSIDGNDYDFKFLLDGSSSSLERTKAICERFIIENNKKVEAELSEMLDFDNTIDREFYIEGRDLGE